MQRTHDEQELNQHSINHMERIREKERERGRKRLSVRVESWWTALRESLNMGGQLV